MAEPARQATPAQSSPSEVDPRPYREITVAALALGVFVGALMTASFVYIGLKLGFGLAGSTVAAILGFAVLRGVGRGVFRSTTAGSIVENNIQQTIASGINTASAGVVFTFPALLLMGVDYSPITVILAATAGSLMGIVVIIPLRKQLIEIERLRFPSGVAVATILKSPGAGIQKALYMGAGFLFALCMTLLTNPLPMKLLTGADEALLPETIPIGSAFKDAFGVADTSGAAVALLGTALSLSMANIGAGLLSGRGGLPFALGGVLAWWVIAPAIVSLGWAPSGASGEDLMWGVYGANLRPVGIGVLIGGALAGVVMAAPAMRGALRSLAAAGKLAKTSGVAPEELSPKVLVTGLVIAFLMLLFVALSATGGEAGISVFQAVSAAVAGTVWLAVAGLIVAQATGMTDISPLSGLALIAVTLMLALTGGHVLVAVTIGVAVCIATNQCADMMSDLKTGQLIGGVPRRQQIAQFAVAWIGPVIAIGTVLLLWEGGGDGPGFGPESKLCLEKQGGCLPAPQASVLKGMIDGVLSGNAPVDKYLAGSLIGISLAAFPLAGLGVLVGLAMYLPFEITLGYGIGCVLNMVAQRFFGRRFIGDVVVPVAAGLIVGEALTNLTLTLIKLVGES